MRLEDVDHVRQKTIQISVFHDIPFDRSESTVRNEGGQSTRTANLWFLLNLTGWPEQHHGRGPRQYYEPKDRELDIHVLKSTAYRRLQQYGLSDRGIVPHFYGTIDNMDPWLYQPHLKAFVNDEYRPSAIFIEYIPDLEMMEFQDYTTKRMDNLIESLKEIHKALIRHGDPKPRNMMIFKNDPERVMWIDFDRAETYDKDDITSRQQDLIQEEEDIVSSIKDCLVSALFTTLCVSDGFLTGCRNSIA